MIDKEYLIIIACLVLALIVIPIVTYVTYPKGHYIGRDDETSAKNYDEMYQILNERCDDICGNQTINGFYCGCGHCNCYCDLNDFKRWRILNNC